jgi:hypothetical protein
MNGETMKIHRRGEVNMVAHALGRYTFDIDKGKIRDSREISSSSNEGM